MRVFKNIIKVLMGLYLILISAFLIQRGYIGLIGNPENEAIFNFFSSSYVMVRNILLMATGVFGILYALITLGKPNSIKTLKREIKALQREHQLKSLRRQL